MKDRDRSKQKIEDLSRETKELKKELYVHEKLQEQLIQSKKEWEQTFDAIPDLVAVIDRENRITRANRALAERLGVDRSEIISKHCHEVFHGTDEPPPFCPRSQTLKTRKEQTSEAYEKHFQGYFLFSSTPLFDKSGRLQGVLEIARDITDRRNAEEEAAQRLAQQAAVADLGQMALSGNPFPELLNEACRLVADHLRVPFVKVLELISGENMFLLRAGKGWKRGLVGKARIKADKGSQAGFTLLSRKPVVVDDLAKEKRFRGPSLLLDHGVTSGVSVIIGARERPFGVLGAHTKKHQTFTEQDIHFLQNVANVLSQTLDRSRAVQALRESEKRFKDISENTLEWIWEVDTKGKYTYASPIVRRILGYKPEEIMTKHFYDLFHPDERTALKKAAFAAFAAKEPFREFVNRNIHKNGRTVWLSTSGIPILGEGGELLGYRGADTDITERMAAEESLRASEEKAKAISDASLDAVITIDGKGAITYFNDAAEKMFGFEREEALGKRLHHLLVSQEALKEYEKKLPRFEKNGQCVVVGKTLEVMASKKDGSRFPIELSISAFKLNGEWHSVGAVRDITARRHMEEKLREASITDELTGLLNRRGFMTLAEKQFEIAKRNKRSFAVIFMDLNELKEINDSLGHEAGDQAIMDISGILKRTFRAADIIARIGGDEFTILLTEPRGETVQQAINNNIRQNIRRYLSRNKRPFPLSVSLGFARYDPDRPSSLNELLAKADELMYEDKKLQRLQDSLPRQRGGETREKRRQKRNDVTGECPAELVLSEDAQIRNISMNGMCISTQQKLNINDVYSIRMHSEEEEPLSPTGVVVWSEPRQHNGGRDESNVSYEAGIRFINVTEKTRKYIKKFITALCSP